METTLIVAMITQRYRLDLAYQMRQSKAMSLDYSLRWWEERNLNPPNVGPEAFVWKKDTLAVQKRITERARQPGYAR
jgi:hypothetical protein